MKTMFIPLLGILTFQISNSMKIDKMIMEAAKSHDTFDLVHCVDGEMMMMVELDMLMTQEQLEDYRNNGTRFKRKAVSDPLSLWDDGIVYYQIDSTAFSNEDKQVIRSAMNEWQTLTCLEFREEIARNYIYFQNGDGCSSLLGKQRRGRQPINLGDGCRHKGIVIHEIGHAIGWIHEQARPDRDEYVFVDFNKIHLSWRDQYRKVPSSAIDDRGVEYDYNSIMHYSGEFSGRNVILTKNSKDQDLIGQREGLSFRDIKLANLMYKCVKNNCQTKTCPGEGFQAKDCECYCPTPNRLGMVKCDRAETMPTSVPGVFTTPAPTGLDCVDLSLSCKRYQENGLCRTDVARMSVLCRKTCIFCSSSSKTQCMDYDDTCPYLAQNGFCELRFIGSYFKEQCPLSCKVPCETQNNMPTPSPGGIPTSAPCETQNNMPTPSPGGIPTSAPCETSSSSSGRNPMISVGAMLMMTVVLCV